MFGPVESRSTAPAVVTSGHVAPLLDLDPDLGRFLPADRRASARQQIPVRVVALTRGPWRIDGLAANPTHLGVLVVEGILGRELLAHDAASMELLGAGDVVRPWDESADSELLQAVARWSALADTRLAILDRHVAGRLAHYPEMHAALLERAAWRARRLAVLQTISQLNRVDRRVLTLLWHLAERWGRVSPDGVVVPLALSHRLIGQLVGARRPTVSSALTKLMHAGDVARGPAGTWILTGEPVGAPDARASLSVAPRRPMLSGSRQALPV
jgi:CRP/FNR family cyclic AMP-dependent transcriptional regulator